MLKPKSVCQLLSTRHWLSSISDNQRKTSTFSSVTRSIGSSLNKSDTNYKLCLQNANKLRTEYDKLMTISLAGGGPKGVDRHVNRNKKILVRDRLKMILDKDTDFLEISPLAGLQMEYGDIPSAGVIAGIGKVCNTFCMIIGNDATVKGGGTVYPITVKKQVRAQEIAQKIQLPCIYVVDSGGAFLPLQASIFPDKEHGGRVFYNEAIMASLGIPQIAVVCGSCTAGGAYIPTMAEEAVMVHRIGTIFLGGPPLVKAATGEVITAEELGGATLHTSVSGCADYFASTEEEAFHQTRASVAALNTKQVHSEHSEGYEEPLFDPTELETMTDPENINAYEVIARLVDGSKVHEFKEKFGPNLVTAWAEIQGQLVGIIANNGHLDRPAAEKGAHFVQLCSSRDIPLIFLQNTITKCKQDAPSGLVNAQELKAHAKMAATVACVDVPKITVIIGHSFGPSNYAMAGRVFEPDLLFTWPSAQIALDDPTILTKNMQAVENVQSDDLEKYSKNLAIKSSAFYSTTRLWDDGLILPQQTRKILAQSLRIVCCASTSVVNRTRPTENRVQKELPVIRM